MEYSWTPIIEQIRRAHRILLTTHINPDGDGLGSELAMYYCLRKMGKEALILNDSVTPSEYRFMAPPNLIQHYQREKNREMLASFELVIVFDIGGPSRLGKLGEDLDSTNLATICIDHHPGNQVDCHLKIVDAGKAATASLVYELIMEMCPRNMDTAIAEALYIGLMTDTGCFRFENTDPAAFELAAALVRYGVKPAKLYQKVYETYTPARMKLLGRVLQNVHYDEGGHLAWFTITRDDLNATGIQLDEVSGFSDAVRSIEGVEVSVMFLETRASRTRINLRSNGKVLVNEIARHFGGGGHLYAAGASVPKSIADAIAPVLEITRNQMSQSRV